MLDWTSGPPSPTACPCCGSKGPHPLVVKADNSWATGEVLQFYRCAGCQSLLVPEGTFHEFSDDESSPVALQHYVQLGAGIDAMMQPAERARRPDASRLLDVGCGFGFTLDYWRHAVGGEAVGVEPSAFGRLGAEMLGLDLHVALLEEVPSLRGRLFDVVLSSEVIEHVPDPAAFVQELRQRLAPGGTVVLTTPNAGFVKPESSLSFVLSTLSPGLHRLLLSQKALDDLLRRAGFTHVRVDAAGQRLVAWASDTAFALHDDPVAFRRGYISYLERRWADQSIGSDLRLGFGYRLLKETVNDGRLGEAASVATGLQELVQQRYRFDLIDPAAVREAVLPTSGLESYAVAAPFPLGPILFYRAMAAAQGALPGEDAAAGFALAHEVLAQNLRIAPDYFQEATTLVWPALLEQAGALLRAGHAEGAAACLARLSAAETGCQQDRPAAVTAEVAERARELSGKVDQALAPPAIVSPASPKSPVQQSAGIATLWQRLRRRRPTGR